MRGKKAKALFRRAQELSDKKVDEDLKKSGSLARRITQKILRTLRGPVKVDRVTQFYPRGHQRRIYQDMKKGAKGVPIKLLCA